MLNTDAIRIIRLTVTSIFMITFSCKFCNSTLQFEKRPLLSIYMLIWLLLFETYVQFLC